MGEIKIYPPVKLFVALTYSPQISLDTVLRRLEDAFSPIDSQSTDFAFSFTQYYQPEMGSGLRKRFASFQHLVLAEMLPEIKLTTNQLEKQFTVSGKRQVNIDPGYVCAAKMVLATTKDYDHRLYLGRGIFGDVHYRFRKGHFHINEWTYPDYQQPEIIRYFEDLRQRYLEQLREWKGEMGE
jgi:hypothetical protein